MPYTLFTRIRYAIDGKPDVQEFRGSNDEREAEVAAWMKSMRDQHGAAFRYGIAFVFADQWYPAEETPR